MEKFTMQPSQTDALDQLRELSQGLLQNDRSSNGRQDLMRAFLQFSEQTERLEREYRELKEDFQAVNGELQESNQQLTEKIAELDRANQYLDSILTHIRQGLIFVSQTGQIQTVNPAAERILSCSAASLQGRPFCAHFPDNLFGFSLQEGLEKGQSVNRKQLAHLGRDLEVTASPIHEKANQGLLILLRDITELRRLEQLATRHERLKELGEMAASVAHEIRNPLGGVRGFASLLCRDLAKDDPRHDFAQQIADGAEVINRLITQVLNYARPLQLRLEPCCLKTLCEELITTLQVSPESPEKGAIRLKTKGALPSCTLDRELIRNCIHNLLLNALQASDVGEQVTLSLDQTEEHALISVTDRGCGIDEEMIEKIFSPFFTTKHDGNGFGLSEVYKTVQAHGGVVEVNSKRGRGSTFILRLPFEPVTGGGVDA
jgi:PAS domain S-box-containing protein